MPEIVTEKADQRPEARERVQDALVEIREVIGKKFGAHSVPPEPRYFKAKSKNAQEAHEAVRPTSAARLPEQVARYLTPDQAKLYELIWKRAVASQMAAVRKALDSAYVRMTVCFMEQELCARLGNDSRQPLEEVLGDVQTLLGKVR